MLVLSGFFFSLGAAFLPVVLLFPAKFAISFSLGSLFFMTAFALMQVSHAYTYAYPYAYTYTYTYTYTHTRTHTRTHTHTHKHTDTPTHTDMHTHTHTYTHIDSHAHTDIHTHTHRGPGNGQNKFVQWKEFRSLYPTLVQYSARCMRV